MYIKPNKPAQALCVVGRKLTDKMKLLILLTLVATAVAAPAAQSMTFLDDGSYRFYYETGKEGGSHSRSEIRNADGVVVGKFSYEDPDGDMREVNYRADDSGYMAQGDVSVKGAQKGQFPIAQDQPKQPTSLPVETADELPAETKQTEVQKQQQSEPQMTHHDYHDEEVDKDDMQDLALEESSANDPPEAFPPGFFLQKFQGLRRLPEPTKKEVPSTTEVPKTTSAEKPTKSEKPEKIKEDKKETHDSATSAIKPVEGSAFLAPFPAPGVPNHQEWASAMFHQPVYVFAYNHPESYGYHYFY